MGDGVKEQILQVNPFLPCLLDAHSVEDLLEEGLVFRLRVELRRWLPENRSESESVAPSVDQIFSRILGVVGPSSVVRVGPELYVHRLANDERSANGRLTLEPDN